MGGLAQLGVAFLGYAIGGPSLVVLLLAVDGLLALLGAVLVSRWTNAGLVLIAVAATAALVALFVTTLLQVGVAVLLFASAAAVLRSQRTAP